MEPSPGPAPEDPRVSKLAALFGLTLVGSAALPWLSDGTSFLDLVIDAFGRAFLEGFLFVVGFGSPFLFGAAVVLGVLVLSPKVARRVIRIPVALMQSQLLLVAITLMTARDRVIAAVALLGFAIVTALGLARHSARTRAEGDGPSLAWYIRWGAVVVAGVAAWTRLQRAAGIELGTGLDVALGSAVLLIVTMGRRRYRAAAPQAD